MLIDAGVRIRVPYEYPPATVSLTEGLYQTSHNDDPFVPMSVAGAFSNRKFQQRISILKEALERLNVHILVQPYRVTSLHLSVTRDLPHGGRPVRELLDSSPQRLSGIFCIIEGLTAASWEMTLLYELDPWGRPEFQFPIPSLNRTWPRHVEW
jgi:hypothetical protein